MATIVDTKDSPKPPLPSCTMNSDNSMIDPNSFRSVDLLGNSKELEEVLKGLNQDGSHLWKVRSASKWFKRKFVLDLNSMCMKYEPSSKSPCFSKAKQHIELGEIVEIRQGWKTDIFNKLEASESKKKSKKPEYKGKVDEKSCFSIIYGPRRDTWDLVAPNPEAAERWVRALNHLLSLYRSREEKQGYERWLRKQFATADLDKSKCLSFPETLRLLKQLNIEMDDSDAKKLFHEANVKKSTSSPSKSNSTKEESLDEDEFVQLYFKLLRRPELERIFDGISGGNSPTINGGSLCAFLKREEGEDFSSLNEDDCLQMIQIYEPSGDLKAKGEMSISGFLNMLLSPRFDIFNGSHKSVYQDMTQPLSHYYIASSHNTYLVGNQLSGASSVEGYVEALKRGCRCVEFDCWDGENDEPIVYHGYTLTTKILFKEILSDAIKPYAFVSSRYPLILSLENHCSEPFQQKMAHHLKTILGDMLYLTDPDDSMQFLPSPESLQGKILIKAKKKPLKPGVALHNNNSSSSPSSPANNSNTIPPPPSTEHETTEPPGVSPGEEEIDDEIPVTTGIIGGVDDGLLSPRSPGWAGPPKASMESLDDSDDSDPDESIDYIDGAGMSSRKLGVSVQLSSLVNLIQAVHFHSFDDSKQHGKCFQMSSFSEAKANNLMLTNGVAFADYNKRQLSRIYPAGSRTSSSNFNPVDYWAVGCQIVALNYQTEDAANFFNHSFFTNNGSCGYILKPNFLRDPAIRFNPKENSHSSRGITLRLKVISGQHIPKAAGNSEVVDPYVEVKVVGVEQDWAKGRTEVVHNNGFNPVWDEVFNFRIYRPELALLYFRVKDYSQSGSDLHLAHYALPIGSISTGYRHIHLCNLKGASLVPASLFVHISMSNQDGVNGIK